jgi:hypothetical protein
MKMKQLKLNSRSKSSGQTIVLVIIVLVLLGVAYWWLASTRQEMAREGQQFANELVQKIVVQRDLNFFASRLSPQERMNFAAPTAQQEFITEIGRHGTPVGPINLQGKIEFQSQFFEPHGTFQGRINYPAEYGQINFTISHPVGRWQIDDIQFIPPSAQAAPAAPVASPPSAAPASAASPESATSPAPAASSPAAGSSPPPGS